MRTQWFCKQLDQLNDKYFREENMNIVTIHSEYIPHDIAHKFDLVPEQHNEHNKWYKIVIMDHVEIDNLMQLVNALKERKGISL